MKQRPRLIRRPSAVLLLLVTALVWSGCSLPKYTTIRSEQPPTYYLGSSPSVRVVAVEGAFRPTQDALINALRNQSMSGGYFTIESGIREGIRFDARGGQAVVTGMEGGISRNDVLVKARIAVAMGQDGRTVITRNTGILGTEEERIPAYVTTVPVAFTVARGSEVVMRENVYRGEVWWPLSDGYPDRYRRLEMAVAAAAEQFLNDITPRTVSRSVRLDYSDEAQEPILDAARDGQVKAAATELRGYVEQHPNSASALYNYAVLTDALGDYEQAIEYYDRALSLGGKDYYTAAKTECMRRLSEQREMQGAQQRAEIAPLPSTPPPAQERTPPPAERPGDGGRDVAWVQQTLNAMGYDCGVADGIMGGNTRACIRAFQEAHSLEATGAVNEATYQKMLEVR